MGRKSKIAVLIGLGLFAFFALYRPHPPSDALRQRIDSVLAANPCFRDTEWEQRIYMWAPSHFIMSAYLIKQIPGIGAIASDHSKVELHFWERQDHILPKGINRIRADEYTTGIYSGIEMYATGTYDVKSGRILDWSCGCTDGQDQCVPYVPEPLILERRVPD